jgi:hypothetical protein
MDKPKVFDLQHLCCLLRLDLLRLLHCKSCVPQLEIVARLQVPPKLRSITGQRGSRSAVSSEIRSRLLMISAIRLVESADHLRKLLLR